MTRADAGTVDPTRRALSLDTGTWSTRSRFAVTARPANSAVPDAASGASPALHRLCRAAVAASDARAGFLFANTDGVLRPVAIVAPKTARDVVGALVRAAAEHAIRENRTVMREGPGPAGAVAAWRCLAVPAADPPDPDPRGTARRAVPVTLCVATDGPSAPGPAIADLLSDLAVIARHALEQEDALSSHAHETRQLQLSFTLNPSRPWIADPDGRLLALSERLTRLTGPAHGQSVDQLLRRVVDPSAREATLHAWEAARRSGEVFDHEVPCRADSGSVAWYRLYATPRRDERGEIVAWHGSSQNVTRLRRDRERLEHLAFRDELTRLHNRAALTAEIDRRIRADADADAGTGGGTGTGFALFAFDIDDFKAVNDTLGYPAGNSVLRRVADEIRSCVRQTDIVARSGADEFFVLLDSTADPDIATGCAERIVQSFRLPIRVDGHSVLVSPSIGITLSARDGRTADELLRNVDLALQRAKREGGGTWRLFEPGMDDALRAVHALKVELRDALPQSQFALEFQPVVDVRDGRIDCFEALLRWHHPTRGLVSPLDFIPLAEATGLIVPIGRWVLLEACRAAASWPGAVRVAVNVSAIQIRHRDLVAAVEMALGVSGLAAERLELEITESILLQDDAESLETIRHLRGRGIRVAVDDFGTGHATPRALNAFPFDKLKIDRAYVAGRATPWTLAIVRAAIAMARSLGLDVVAEGVERPEERDRIQAEGCHLFQGFLFGPPVSAGTALSLIAGAEAPDRSDVGPVG